MVKQKIKIGFCDFWEAMEKFFVAMLSPTYDVEIDNENPDFLFFSVEDNGSLNGPKFNHRTDVTKILYTGENRRPDNYVCDYAITYDHNFYPWHYRLPLYVVEMWAIPFHSGLREYPINYINYKPKINPSPENFCGFVHRNGGNPVRNEFFHQLSEYKKVTSSGPLFNNTGILAEGIKGKIDFYSKCKFAMCFENSSHPGYVTEKILHAFYSGALPIYWGSPTIAKDFNEASFINVGNFGSAKSAIEYIKEVDSSDELYASYLNNPKIIYNIPNDCMIYQNFKNWFDAVVFQKRLGKRSKEMCS